ncbi:MAG: CBS domain-containing protein [Deltaproteobacteria bacterium]|nr:CBS domain-containing protein [Deltaproteobacteria bacterium]
MHTVKDIMTKNVITVTPDLGVDKLAALFWQNNISGAPVVDAEGRVVAVVTESDLIDQAKKIHIPTMISFWDSVIMLGSAEKLEKEIGKMTGTTVSDICSKKVITVHEDTSIEEIATIMSEKNIHTIPVLAGNELVGIVGKNDIIRTLAKREEDKME